MSGRFDWQTDEDGAWSAPEGPRRPGRGSRRLWTVALLIFLGAGLLYALYQFSQRRLSQREAVVKTEVLAAHNTWQQAVARGDLELLTSLTDRDEAGWFTAQRRLLLAGRTLDRTALGLKQDGDAPPLPEAVLSSDLSSAELTYLQSYRPVGADDETPLLMAQTAYYERRGALWLQRPPTAEEWGPELERANVRVVATFPQRDAELIGRLAADLSRDLGDLCEQAARQAQSVSRLCDPAGRIRLAFLTDPMSLLALAADQRPSLSGTTFRLPTPTLVGKPLDDAGYALLYQGYTDRILTTLRQVVAQPIPLPAQDIAALCYVSENSRLSLVTYRPSEDLWSELPADKPYRYLWSMPDDNGFILRAGLPGIDLDRLQLTLYRDDQRLELLDVGQAQLTASVAGLVTNSTGQSLVLRLGQGSTGTAFYRWVPLATCNSGGCTELEVDGFPSWSPDGKHTLINDAGRLMVGDGQGRARSALDDGFSPFWLSPTRFGYVALPQDRADADMRVIVQDVLSDQRTVIADSVQLMQAAGVAAAKRLRIRYATVSPTDPLLILLAGTPAGDSAGQYFILGVRLQGQPDSLSDLAAGPPEVIARLPGAPVGDPAVSTPTGSPPFAISGNGRWLVAVRFADPFTNAWELNLTDLTTGETQIITTNHPPYPAPFPFFDWSADGQWLVVVDNGFLRLIAPDYNYERVVSHDFRSCSYTAWVNR
jgi:hypothetical protein